MATQDVVGTGPTLQKRAGFEQRVTKALAGVTQYLPAATTLVLNGKSMTQPEIVKAFQDALQLRSDLRAVRTQAQAQLALVRSEEVRERLLYRALQRAMQAYLGEGNPVLAQFGYSLGTRTPRTGAANVRAQAKSQLTRALRHTMGPKQRAAIRSVAPTAVTIAPDGTVRAVAAPKANGAVGGEVSARVDVPPPSG